MSQNFEEIIDKYNKTLREATAKHEEMLSNAKAEFQTLMENSAAQLEQLTTPVHGSEEEKVEQPESQWVKDHLVLNKPAAEMMQKVFEDLGFILPEVAKVLKAK